MAKRIIITQEELVARRSPGHPARERKCPHCLADPGNFCIYMPRGGVGIRLLHEDSGSYYHSCR